MLVLFAALLSGCAIAAGETRRGDTPLRQIGDQLTMAIAAATFPWTPAPDSTSGAMVQSAAAAISTAVTVKISAGGTGISLRTDCADAARSGGAWTDNTQVDVIEYGSGRCAGWTRATTGGVTSWVRDEYLAGLPPAGQRTAPAAPSVGGSLQIAQLRGWTSRVVDGAGRLALLSRHSPDSMESNLTAMFIEVVRDEMRAVSAEIGSAAGSGNAMCDNARRPLIDAANALADLAQRMYPMFTPGGEVPTGLEALVARYAAAQGDAARSIAGCAKA
ncbi:MAG: hypothetical protein EXR66_02080 [Dehalococcoidia bacterium]|nr:hypothetical protein [Dehalococcoidia bacterium]